MIIKIVSIRSFLILVFLLVINQEGQTQMKKVWKGKECAVVLTYDDGLDVDLQNAVPALNSFGLKGTFYISDYFNGLNGQIFKWRRVALNGHELANHSVWHPCEGGIPGREFIKGDYDLNKYTIRRMTDEVRTMNNILKAIDGKSIRTFAYPCGDTRIHDSSYIEGLKGDFIAARGVKSEMVTIDKIDLYNIGCYMINGQTGEQLIELVKKSQTSHSLLVFLFHGVGGGHSLNVSIDAHNKLLNYLKQQRNNIWVAPMVEVAEYIKIYQLKKTRL